MDGRASRSGMMGPAVGLGLLAVVGVLVWLWLRPSAPEPPGSPSTEVTASSSQTRRSPRRPPPRRLGLIDAPRASTRADDLDSGALGGTVTSWLDSTPVEGAELTFMGGGSIQSTVTDARGRFSLVAPTPGPYTLASVLADGYQPYAPELGQASLHYEARAGQRVDGMSIQLMPRTEVRGQVVDARGDPVSGATVRWLGVGTGEAALADDEPEYRSDARGEFRFEARRGRWLEGEHPERGVGRVRVDERAMAVGRLTLSLRADALRADGRIAGQVREPSGGPAVGARVLASRDGSLPGGEAVTDDEGRFELLDLVPGAHRIEARLPPFAPIWASRVPTGSDAVQLTLAPGGAIVGTVTTAAGDVVPGSTVMALRHTGPLTRAAQARATVFDAEGEFSLEGLPPGVYDVVGGAADHAPTRARDVEVGSARVEVSLVLPDGGSIAGRVIDAKTGEAVAQARVEVDSRVAAGASIAPMRTSGLSDDAGAWRVRGVEPGRHSIYVYALGYAPRALSGIEVAAGLEAGPALVELTPAQDATGEAFDIVGIGVMVRVDGEALEVSGVIEGGGAERAGVQPDDRIVAIDGVPVADLLDFGEAVEALRGREGTEVELSLERGEPVDVFERTVVRSRVRG